MRKLILKCSNLKVTFQEGKTQRENAKIAVLAGICGNNAESTILEKGNLVLYSNSNQGNSKFNFKIW